MSGRDYDARWERLEAEGHNPHGEADFVESLLGGSGRVLDAGCGTGRVAIELARRGFEVAGVDIDDEMISGARAKEQELGWHQMDLTVFDLGEVFDAVVMAGNVLLFTAPGTEAAVVGRCAAHLSPGGFLVAGFQLRAGGYGLDRYDADCAVAGLTLSERYSTWERSRWTGGDYAVSVHSRTKARD